MIQTALVWSERFLALAIFFQTIELLQLRSAWSDQGVWRAATLGKDRLKLPSFIQVLLNFLFKESNFNLLLWIRLVVSVGVWLISPYSLFIAILFLSTWLIAIRWRGIFNGGSDSMTALVGLSLWIAQSFSHHPLVVKACFAYIAIQVTASYFLAGVSKLKNAEWRRGAVLPVFFNTPRYDSPPDWVRKLFDQPRLAKSLSVLVIIFEFGFPLCWINPTFCLGYLGLAFGFHLVNFWVFGLNRFVFAWLAGYPAVYFWSHHL